MAIIAFVVLITWQENLIYVIPVTVYNQSQKTLSLMLSLRA